MGWWLRVVERIERADEAERIREQIALLDASLDDRCPACGHSRAEQGVDESGPIPKWWRRWRGKPPLPAKCWSTVGMPHVLAECRCRHPFHGS